MLFWNALERMAELGVRKSGLRIVCQAGARNKTSAFFGRLDPNCDRACLKPSPTVDTAGCWPSFCQNLCVSRDWPQESPEGMFYGIADDTACRDQLLQKQSWWHVSAPAVETGYAWCMIKNRNLPLELESRLWGHGTRMLSWAQGNCPRKSVTWNHWEGVLQTTDDLKCELEPRVHKMSCPRAAACCMCWDKAESRGPVGRSCWVLLGAGGCWVQTHWWLLLGGHFFEMGW